MASSQRLSDIQLHLLRFFSERVVSNEETGEIRQVIARYYSEKADELMEGIWENKELSEEKLDLILNPTADF